MTTTTYTDRQRAEKEWHDHKFTHGGEGRGTKGIDRAYQRFWEAVGEPRNFSILDFGCGDGWLSIKLAKQGNRAEGFDISTVLIERARQFARREGVEARASFQEMTAEELTYPDDTFDMVIGTSILHHVELEKTLKQIRRVMKADGRALFMEPLNVNPVLRLWRLLTPSRRSHDERAFTQDDLQCVRRVFPASRFHFFGLMAMFSAGLLLAAPGSRTFGTLHAWLEDIDERLIGAFPSLGRFAAVAVLDMRK